MTTHDFDDGDHALVVYTSVVVDLGAGCCNVLCSRCITWAVVCAKEVVVDCLWNTHDAALIANLHHVLGDLVAGIHGVVTAVVEEVTNIVLLEDLKNALVIGIIHIGISQKYNVRYFFYNGGNDSMDTCNKISKYMQKVGYECRIMGVPKTIDNDLNGTDHCPGFASAAKYIATTCAEVWQDAHVYDTGMITVIEIMGRHAGWLAGSAALAGLTGCGPDLVYLPETDFDMDTFIADVKKIYDATGKCLIAVSEGIHYADGTFVSEAKTSATDGFGHAQLGGLAVMLADILKAKTGAKVRGIELSLLQRCASHVASATDVEEAWLAGSAAVEAAVSGVTDKMVAFDCTRDENGYTCKTVLQPLDIVANFEKKVPREWINAEGNGIEQPFIDYVLPLIQGVSETPKENGLPRFAHLKKVLTVDM